LGNNQILPFVLVLGLVSGLLFNSPASAQSGPDDSRTGRGESDRESDVRIARTVGQFNEDAAVDRAFAGILVELLGVEYRTPVSELRWAGDRVSGTAAGGIAAGGEFGWGDVAVLAYLQATTGWSFSDLIEAGAHNDFPDFVDTMEMSHQRMAASFDALATQVIRERNSMIFDRIRSAPRSGGLEDLGAGFGLFQESLDFRQLDPPGPTKVHEGGGRGIVSQVENP
jgi:hypothetical protein